MEVETHANEDIDLSHEEDNCKKTDEVETNEDNSGTPCIEMNDDDEQHKLDQELGSGEPVKLRKKSMKRSPSAGNLTDECRGEKNNNQSGQMDKKEELDEGDDVGDDGMTEVVFEQERPTSMIQQIGLFLVLLAVLIVINQAVIKLIFYFFKPDGAGKDNSAQMLSSKYEKEEEFSEFDRIMEH